MFCHQVAALVPDMSYYFYLIKNHHIANNYTTTKLDKKGHILGILTILEKI
jgi:hypothetical protein